MPKQTVLQNKNTANLSRFMKPVDDTQKGGEVKKRTARRSPTPKQIKAAKLISENISADKPKTKGEILKEAGYSDSQSSRPSAIIESDSFQALLDEFLPDNLLTETHKRLLTTRKIEHMVFPLEHQDPSDLDGGFPIDEALREEEIERKRIIDNLSDEDIIDMLLEVNCVVRKIIHGETARHVYFWAHDATAQGKALELGYKIKGHVDKDSGNNAPNFFALFGNNTVNFVKKGEGNS